MCVCKKNNRYNLRCSCLCINRMGVGGGRRACILQVSAFPAAAAANLVVASTRYLRLPKGLVGFWKGYYIYKRCRRFVFLEFFFLFSLLVLDILYWRFNNDLLNNNKIWLMTVFYFTGLFFLVVFTSPRTKTLL